MAREVTISVWCDACKGETDARTEATATETLTIGNQTRVLDLCEPHRDKITGQIREWLSWGTKPDSATPRLRNSGGRLQCPLCGATSASRDALGKHARKIHGKTLPELLEAGAEGGELGPKGEAPELAFRCELCPAAYSMARGLGVHKRHAHGIVGASTAEAARRASRAAEGAS